MPQRQRTLCHVNKARPLTVNVGPGLLLELLGKAELEGDNPGAASNPVSLPGTEEETESWRHCRRPWVQQVQS